MTPAQEKMLLASGHDLKDGNGFGVPLTGAMWATARKLATAGYGWTEGDPGGELPGMFFSNRRGVAWMHALQVNADPDASKRQAADEFDPALPDVALRTDRFGIPYHAFPQADGRYMLCKRRVELCKACKEHGVPLIPKDPHQVALELFRAHWNKPWRELYRLPRAIRDDATINEATGAHIIALSDDGGGVTVIGQFGPDDSVMLALGALVAAHNEQIGVI